MTYRADINGLRALAVSVVVLCHADVPYFNGGYVGVDVFFVISGFLITQILLREADAGHLSIIDFYERRIRRIFPALFCMMLFVLLANLLFYMPFDLRRTGMQIVAATGFMSNILYWLNYGYFEVATHNMPLLHIWSLAVEEQYYIVYPFLIAAIVKYRRQSLFAIVAAIAAVSLAYSLYQIGRDPMGAFYLPMGRAWELMIGGLIAIRPPVRVNSRTAAWAGLAGLGLIVFAVVTYTSKTKFPGWYALAPCVGAALIILAGYGPPRAVTRLLSHSWLVGIGLISYSLYLWHWPLIVFAKYLLIRDMATWEALSVIALSVGCAVLSWRYVEQPFRDARSQVITKTHVFLGAGGVMAVSAACGLLLYVSGGLPGRLGPGAQALAQGAFDTTLVHSNCHRRSPAQIATGDVCDVGAKSGERSFAVFGDSIGTALMPGFDEAGRFAGRKGIDLTRGGCYALVGVVQVNNDPAFRDACRVSTEASLALIAASPSIKTVVVVNRWATAAEGTTFGEEGAVGWFNADAETKAVGTEENQRVLERALVRLARTFADREIIYVIGVPEQRFNVPRTASLLKHLGRDMSFSVSRAQYDQRQASARAIFGALPASANVRILDLGSSMCTASECPATFDGRALYTDDNHPSIFGARWLADVLAKPLIDKQALGPVDTRNAAAKSQQN